MTRQDVHKDELVESVTTTIARHKDTSDKRQEDTDMSCERCGGFMVIDTFCDRMEEESRTGIDTIRCLNCGNFEDTIIRTNRASSSRVPSHVEPHTVGTGKLSALKPRLLERATQVESVIAECLRGRAPRLPVGASSVKTRRLESAHSEQLTPIVQT